MTKQNESTFLTQKVKNNKQPKNSHFSKKVYLMTLLWLLETRKDQIHLLVFQ